MPRTSELSSKKQDLTIPPAPQQPTKGSRTTPQARKARGCTTKKHAQRDGSVSERGQRDPDSDNERRKRDLAQEKFDWKVAQQGDPTVETEDELIILDDNIDDDEKVVDEPNDESTYWLDLEERLYEERRYKSRHIIDESTYWLDRDDSGLYEPRSRDDLYGDGPNDYDDRDDLYDRTQVDGCDCTMCSPPEDLDQLDGDSYYWRTRSEWLDDLTLDSDNDRRYNPYYESYYDDWGYELTDDRDGCGSECCNPSADEESWLPMFPIDAHAYWLAPEQWLDEDTWPTKD